MTSQGGVRSRLDDWLNPIVVKELRQAVHGKFVAAALLLLLIVQLAALGIYIVSNGDFTGRFDAGRNAFMFLLAILMAIPWSGLRLPAFFLFSGGASGVAWAALMSLLTYLMVSFLAASSVTLSAGGGSIKESQVWVGGLALYGLAYSMTACFSREGICSRAGWGLNTRGLSRCSCWPRVASFRF